MQVGTFRPGNLLIMLMLPVLFLASCHRREHIRVAEGEKRKEALFKKKIKHIVVIYEENWSFDGLFGDFPNCNNLTQAHNTRQYGLNGLLLDTAPQPFISTYKNPHVLDDRFNGITLPAMPYDLLKYINPATETGDLRHLFYNEQLQIDSGKMDKFIANSDNGGLTMSYVNLHNQLHLLDTLEWKLASQYTLCDNFFHSAFGGSFLNHIWFVSASSPDWSNPPAGYVCQPKSQDPDLRDRRVTPDGYVVNTSYSINTPHPHAGKDSLVPYQKKPTIGDRLIEAKVNWAWYSGGWDSAVIKDGVDPKFNFVFQYHHQPLLYFETFKEGSENKRKYIKDEERFFDVLKTDSMPSVCFIKPFGSDNEHPGYSDLWTGMLHAQKLVDSIRNSKYWDETVIIITSDENGGRWDHVAPPQIDRWGPGTRIPALIISPYAKKGFVDHTQYETVSILKLIETRFGLKPLTNRDGMANNLLNAFDF